MPFVMMSSLLHNPAAAAACSENIRRSGCKEHGNKYNHWNINKKDSTCKIWGSDSMENKIKIVSLVRIGGKVYRQEELDPEEFRRLLAQRMDEAMSGLGYERVREE